MPAWRAQIDADRFGVVFGADMMYTEGSEIEPAFFACMNDGKFDFSRWGEVGMREMYPLWLLKYLPNMPACHVAIAHDAARPEQFDPGGRGFQPVGGVRGRAARSRPITPT